VIFEVTRRKPICY